MSQDGAAESSASPRMMRLELGQYVKLPSLPNGACTQILNRLFFYSRHLVGGKESNIKGQVPPQFTSYGTLVKDFTSLDFIILLCKMGNSNLQGCCEN